MRWHSRPLWFWNGKLDAEKEARIVQLMFYLGQDVANAPGRPQWNPESYDKIVAPENLVVSNGAKHSLLNAFLAILNEDDEVIIPSPFWLSYPEMVKLAGANPVIIETTSAICSSVTS